MSLDKQHIRENVIVGVLVKMRKWLVALVEWRAAGGQLYFNGHRARLPRWPSYPTQYSTIASVSAFVLTSLCLLDIDHYEDFF